MSINPSLKIINTSVNRDELRLFLYSGFGDMLKAVVDLDQKIMAVGGELHADEEALLLENGSEQKNLWGINLYLDKQMPEMIEFDSMINIRPSQRNSSRTVEDENIQKDIIAIVKNLVTDL